MSPRIARFQWDNVNLAHVALHGLTRVEIEEAFLDPFAILEDNVSRKGEIRFRMIDRTDEGRVLSAAFVIREGEIRLVTAHPSKGKRLRRYEAGRPG